VKRGSWSLARRLTGLFLVSTTVFVIAISVVSAWFLHQSVRRELEALLPQEISELRARFDAGIRDDEKPEFAKFVTDLDNRYAPDHLAVRVWEKDGVTVWGDFGNIELLHAEYPAPLPVSIPQTIDREKRWDSERLASGQTVGVVVDGSPILSLQERYEVFATVLVLCGTGLTLVLSRVFFQRVSGLLATVAAKARAVREPDSALDMQIEGAPREIQEVADALHEMLENIRRETDQARIFTAGLAHELRSPVQNLIGETEVALIALRDATTYRDVLVSHLEELRALGDAVDNLVTICSAKETARSPAREHFDLAHEARIRLQRERASAERHGMRVDIAAHGDTQIHGDREALLRALRNLVANAIQWSPPAGAVDVEIAGSDGEITIHVDDAGPGVPEHLRERIFEPFFRGPAASGHRVGYGLGLAITRTAVEDQGGRIEVGPSRKGGARFSVRLPRRSEFARGGAARTSG
jgi:two-component system heavy metal sensor histidine kinase CusS